MASRQEGGKGRPEVNSGEAATAKDGHPQSHSEGPSRGPELCHWGDSALGLTYIRPSPALGLGFLAMMRAGPDSSTASNCYCIVPGFLPEFPQ